AGKYKIEQQLGSGRTSTVFKAVDTTNDTVVALKIFTNQFVSGESTLACLLEEIQKRVPISHPNVNKILEHGQCHFNHEPVTSNMAHEYLEGGSLSDIIATFIKDHYTLKNILTYIDQILTGLTAVHSHGIAMSHVHPKRLFFDDK